jgi:hypothetical protein
MRSRNIVALEEVIECSEKAGFKVFTANDFGTVIKLTMTQTFEVLIPCQSLSISECMGFLTIVREVAPSTRIIILDNTRAVSELKRMKRLWKS